MCAACCTVMQRTTQPSCRAAIRSRVVCLHVCLQAGVQMAMACSSAAPTVVQLRTFFVSGVSCVKAGLSAVTAARRLPPLAVLLRPALSCRATVRCVVLVLQGWSTHQQPAVLPRALEQHVHVPCAGCPLYKSTCAQPCGHWKVSPVVAAYRGLTKSSLFFCVSSGAARSSGRARVVAASFGSCKHTFGACSRGWWEAFLQPAGGLGPAPTSCVPASVCDSCVCSICMGRGMCCNANNCLLYAAPGQPCRALVTMYGVFAHHC
jgi:hypothetical protein